MLHLSDKVDVALSKMIYMAKVKLLIIDDDDINNFILIKMIQESGIRASCKSVLNGESGLKLLKKLDKKGELSYPDIIFLDLNMPSMSGFDFLNLYEEELYERHKGTLIFMLSASLKAEDKAKAKTYASITNFISKPISLILIKEILDQFLLTPRNV